MEHNLIEFNQSGKVTGFTLQGTIPKSLRILIVEDEPETVRAVRQFFEFRGHQVESAGSGPAAMEIAEDQEPQIAICDFKIEGSMDGVDVAKHLRSRFDIPVVMVTGHQLSQAKRKARQIQADIQAFRRKPIILSDLADLVETIMDTD